MNGIDYLLDTNFILGVLKSAPKALTSSKQADRFTSRAFEPSARPMGDVFLQQALVEGPTRLLDDKLQVPGSKNPAPRSLGCPCANPPSRVARRQGRT